MRNPAPLLVLLLASACFNKAKVHDVQGAPVRVPAHVTASSELTRAAIARALKERGWIVLAEEEGAMLASVTADGHSAKASIEYDDLTYSIEHVESSPGLKYDGREIHRRYNTWVKNLRETIDRQLMHAEPEAASSGGEGAPVLHEPPVGPVTAPPEGKVPAAAEPEAPPSRIVDEGMPPAPPPP